MLELQEVEFQGRSYQETNSFINVYFDTVGGVILDFMFTQMAACGEVSNYNKSASTRDGLKNWFEVISMRLQIRGFIVNDYLSNRAEVWISSRRQLRKESQTLASRLYRRNLWRKYREFEVGIST